MLTAAQDTLVVDTAALNAWRQNPDFDYASELVQKDSSLWQWLENKISRWLGDTYDALFLSDSGVALSVVVGVSVIVAVAVFLFYKRPGLFFRNEKASPISYEVGDDTIYGIDFAAAIASAMERGDCREAVRLVYLQVLKSLSDKEKIDWKPYKTPSQFTREFPLKEFLSLSNHYLRIRYGNFDADVAVVEEMFRLREEIGKAVVAAEGGER